MPSHTHSPLTHLPLTHPTPAGNAAASTSLYLNIIFAAIGVMWAFVYSCFVKSERAPLILKAREKEALKAQYDELKNTAVHELLLLNSKLLVECCPSMSADDKENLTRRVERASKLFQTAEEIAKRLCQPDSPSASASASARRPKKAGAKRAVAAPKKRRGGDSSSSSGEDGFDGADSSSDSDSDADLRHLQGIGFQRTRKDRGDKNLPPKSSMLCIETGLW